MLHCGMLLRTPERTWAMSISRSDVALWIAPKHFRGRDQSERRETEREREREREWERDNAQEQAPAPHCKLGANGRASDQTVVIKVECSRFDDVFAFTFSKVVQKKCELTIPVAKSLCTHAFSQVVALGLPPPIENDA